MANKDIKCVECGETFTWSEREQTKYTEKGWTEPKRCGKCREARRKREAEKK